ncbi:unnamed protein product [Closterium sp. NIES-53]
MRYRFTMTSSPLLQLASSPSPLPLAFDVRPTSLRGSSDFWAFFQQRQDKLEDTTRQSFSDQSEASACSELRDNPECPKAIEDSRVDEDGQVDDVRISDGGIAIVKTSSSSSSLVSPQNFLQQQLSLPKRRPLGPPVQGSYLSKREDDKGKKPLFSFGVITDVQYADINDGQSFLGIPRFYRHSLQVVKKAVEDWNQSTRPMAFAVHFGDIVDGFCPRDRSEEAVNTVLDAMAGFTAGPTYHMIGNHCLYNLPRVALNKMLAIPTAADNRSYYDFSPFPNFRFVVLDSYDVSLLGWPEDHPHAVKAREVLERENPNEEKNSPEGLEGLNRRFVKFNGGVGEEQLRWLEGVLSPIEPAALPTATCLVWNYDEVRLLHPLPVPSSLPHLYTPPDAVRPLSPSVSRPYVLSCTQPCTLFPIFPPSTHSPTPSPHVPTDAGGYSQARVCGSSDSRARALQSKCPRRQRHPPLHFGGRCGVPPFSSSPIPPPPSSTVTFAHVKPTPPSLLTCIHPPRPPTSRPPPTPQRHPPPHFGGRCGVPPFSSSPIPPPPSSTVAFAHVKPTPPSLLTCIHPPRPPTSRPPPTPQVLATIHRHECVAAVIAGHAHFGAYALDARGIHHRILEGAVECPPGTVAFGHVDVYPDRLCIIGTDRMLCTEMKFPCRPGAPDLDRMLCTEMKFPCRPGNADLWHLPPSSRHHTPLHLPSSSRAPGPAVHHWQGPHALH